MTIFIPEWGAGSASGRELQLRRVLRDLGDCAAVRKPLSGATVPPDYFLEHDNHGWLALAICPAPYGEICDGQLFAPKARAAFLHDLDTLSAADDALPKLLVMWACSESETALLTQQVGLGKEVTLWSREQFARAAAPGLRDLMRPLSVLQTTAVRRRYFPESEIASLSAGRRYFQRDNGARLTGIFLDREQEWASKLDLTVPDEQAVLTRDVSVRLLNGVAGSGKTLIALQRAIFLAQTWPAQQVLLLIHNAPVVADLAERMHRGQRVIPENLKICTFSKWAVHQWKAVFGSFPKMPGNAHEIHRLLRTLLPSAPPLRLGERELLDEINFLNDAMISDEAAYLDADRSGRGYALREHERRQVWGLHQQLAQQLRARGLRLWSAIASGICQSAQHHHLDAVDHVLVDEAQFMAPASLQLIKLALRPGGSMFLCADPRQGFLKSRLSWKSAGLDVAGRTKKLHRSYRTTEALLRSATRLLARDVEDDPEDYLAPDFAGMEAGMAPMLITVETPHDAVDRIVSEIANLAAQTGFPLSAILVVYGEGVSKSLLYGQLCQRIGAAKIWWMNKDRAVPPNGYGGEHIRLVNVDSATGLEGIFVFLLGVEELLWPRAANAGPERRAEAQARKLYMAMTRSCYRLSVVTTQALPDTAIAGIFERRA